MVGGLGWHYRGKIADKLGLVAQKPSDASLLAFNNENITSNQESANTPATTASNR